MDMRGVMLFLHLIGLALWFGVTLTLALLAVRANRTGDRAVIAFTYRAGHRVLMGPGLIGMLLTTIAGFGLAGVGGYGVLQPQPHHWQFQMQVLGLIAFVLAVAIQIPNSGRLARAADASANAEEDSASFVKFRKTNAIVGSINGVLILIATLLGALRPF
ncbi:DUF2269 family protein [Candidatus Palauibacter sp.]|uniref:DUF2269 family protein n=1 Tax=Candidatus Palauibacter sp. TaxID=3101350 RepID=UPI003AF25045